jgi:hypothetical protein
MFGADQLAKLRLVAEGPDGHVGDHAAAKNALGLSLIKSSWKSSSGWTSISSRLGEITSYTASWK